MVYRVIQWTSGGVATDMVDNILRNPNLELVGMYCYSKEKIGKDAGTLCGLPPCGIKATNNIDELLALKADVVNYNPQWPNTDEMCRILESGTNIVTCASFIDGTKMNKEFLHPSGRKVTDLLEEACQRGKSTLFGSGMSPGLDNVLGLVVSGACTHIEKLTVIESVDVSCHHSVGTWESVAYGLPKGHPDIEKMLRTGTSVFEDSVYVMADALGLKLDEVIFRNEVGYATEDIEMCWWTIKKGCVAAHNSSWIGMVDGKERVEMRMVYQMGFKTDPCWKVEHGYVAEIKGFPDIRLKMSIFPPRGLKLDEREYQRIGMSMTGMPLLNAIPEVVKAKPGIMTLADMTVRGLCATAFKNFSPTYTIKS